MTDFEQELRESLKRREPPRQFAATVLARVRESDRRSGARQERSRAWRWIPAAAMVIVLAAGTIAYRERHRRIEKEQSKEKLMFALQITSSKLRLIQQRLDAIEHKTIELPLQRQ
jgi:hypothetical protein